MFWNVRAIPTRTTSCGLSPVMSAAIERDPPFRRDIQAGDHVEELSSSLRRSGPMRLTIDPRGIVKSMSLTAIRPPKRFVQPVATSRSPAASVPRRP
jgi:hypothetical protein